MRAWEADRVETLARILGSVGDRDQRRLRRRGRGGRPRHRRRRIGRRRGIPERGDGIELERRGRWSRPGRSRGPRRLSHRSPANLDLRPFFRRLHGRAVSRRVLVAREGRRHFRRRPYDCSQGFAARRAELLRSPGRPRRTSRRSSPRRTQPRKRATSTTRARLAGRARVFLRRRGRHGQAPPSSTRSTPTTCLSSRAAPSST